jgi:hypothetical protein
MQDVWIVIKGGNNIDNLEIFPLFIDELLLSASQDEKVMTFLLSFDKEIEKRKSRQKGDGTNGQKVQ